MSATPSLADAFGQLLLPEIVTPFSSNTIENVTTGNTYFIGSRFSEGYFSDVYECRDTWDNELVAKVLKSRDRNADQLREAASREFDALMRMRHPAITSVYDAFEFEGNFFIIIERCLGPIRELFSLDGYKGSIWLKPIARVVLQAIHFIHRNDYLHKDMHLNNVFSMVKKDDIVPDKYSAMTFKLGDLGLANVVEQIDPNNTLMAQWMIPPEFLEPREFGTPGNTVDIYHCGLLLLHVAYGRELTFTRDEVLAGAPRSMALALEPPLSTALEKSLRRHTAFRTATALEFWRDLNSPSVS